MFRLTGVKLHCVPAGNVAHFWPDISGFIEAACLKGPGSISGGALKEACEQGRNQLWIATKGQCYWAAAITEVLVEPYRNVLEVIALGGHDMDQWIDFERTITEMAKKEMGVSASRIICRPGIMRKMEPRGYRVRGFIMERQL